MDRAPSCHHLETSARGARRSRNGHVAPDTPNQPASKSSASSSKFGGAPGVTVAEGQCLWALRHALPNFPVSEIYGWTHDDGEVFIFMELVQGVTLEDRWVALDRTERTGICTQLRSLLAVLRSLRHAPDDGFFLGHVNREPLGDIVFTNENRPPAGPFQSVAEFHDWLSLQIRTGVEAHWPGKQPWEIPDPYRDGMPDDAEVVFTHADLHPSNIIASRGSPCKIVALIDWRQSGWYPEYWECCKAFYTAEVRGEWMEEYIPLFSTSLPVTTPLTTMRGPLDTEEMMCLREELPCVSRSARERQAPLLPPIGPSKV